MKPVTIRIEHADEPPLGPKRLRYCFQVLMDLAGLPCRFHEAADRSAVDICYGKAPRGPCRIFIRQADIRIADVGLPLDTIVEGGRTFFAFSPEQRAERVTIGTDGQTRIHNDILLTSFYLLAGLHERSAPRDRHDRPLAEDSLLYKANLLHQPIINQYAQLLCGLLAESHEPLPVWPGGKRYAVALSHDVDYPEMVRTIEILRYIGRARLRTVPRKIVEILRGEDHFWRFHDWARLEGGRDVRSAFYFCGRKGSLAGYLCKAPDPFYDVRRPAFREIMRFLEGEGFEIGMHASYDAWRSSSMLAAEKNAVEIALGKPVFGNRHHYWRLRPSNPGQSALDHADVGLVYDSSVCYEHRPGFRFGICSPFHLYDVGKECPSPCLELPTTLMDDHLFGYARHCRFESCEREVDTLLDAVARAGGVFAIDYHVRTLNGTFFPGWGAAYARILDRIQSSSDAYVDTPLNLARHWLERERSLRKAAKS